MRNLFFELLAGATVAVLASNPAAAQSSSVSPSEDVRRLMMSGSVSAAKEKLSSCADAQDAECQYLLAEWIELGELYQRDLEAARKLYTLSYRNGFEKAGSAILRLAKQSEASGSVAATAATSATSVSGSNQVPEEANARASQIYQEKCSQKRPTRPGNFYPQELAGTNIYGTAVLIIDVNPCGEVRDFVGFQKSTRNRVLDNAARDAVMSWVLDPKKLGLPSGRGGRFTVPVEFSPKRGR